jgi:hypothetical protein
MSYDGKRLWWNPNDHFISTPIHIFWWDKSVKRKWGWTMRDEGCMFHLGRLDYLILYR